MNARTPLTKDFFLDEFTRSDLAARRGQEIVVEVGSEIHNHLLHLCETILQPLREGLGRPVTVLSGYRPEWLNAAVGGSRSSDHMLGLAADIVVPGVPPLEVCRHAASLGLPYRQLIHEYGRWTHLSAPRPGQDAARQELTAHKVGGRTRYAPGLHSLESLTIKEEAS